ncbi:hypothetical protein STEG23_002374 [Scotinomys teguina]
MHRMKESDKGTHDCQTCFLPAASILKKTVRTLQTGLQCMERRDSEQWSQPVSHNPFGVERPFRRDGILDIRNITCSYDYIRNIICTLSDIRNIICSYRISGTSHVHMAISRTSYVPIGYPEHHMFLSDIRNIICSYRISGTRYIICSYRISGTSYVRYDSQR